MIPRVRSNNGSEVPGMPNTVARTHSENANRTRTTLKRQKVARASSFPADRNNAARSRHSSSLSNVRRSPISKSWSGASGFSRQRKFPGMVLEDDSNKSNNIREQVDDDNIAVVRLLEKIPESVWLPNIVQPRHRWKAHCYWIFLLAGYLIYTLTALKEGFDRRSHPPVEQELVKEPFQLPDVRFCFDGETHGAKVGCWSEGSDGVACAESFVGQAFVYGYTYTADTNPDSFVDEDWRLVMWSERVSKSCASFKLSTLRAIESSQLWNFHMLVSWNSSYDPTANTGAFESVKLYLAEGDADEDSVRETPISLYVPISFNPTVAWYVRGFVTYSQHVNLTKGMTHTYSVADTTASTWNNAECAITQTNKFGTDTLASIQLDIRSQSYLRLSDIDPLDIVGTLGEISGFWLVVPLMFGLLFYRPGGHVNRNGTLRRIQLFKPGRKPSMRNTPRQRSYIVRQESGVGDQWPTAEGQRQRSVWPCKIRGVASFEDARPSARNTN